MDFDLTETQREYRDRARGIAEEKLLPGYQARERSGRIDPELRREIGRIGLIAPELPTELGGRGLDRLTAGVVTEEIGRGDINVAYLQVVGSLVGQNPRRQRHAGDRARVGASDLRRGGDRRDWADRAAGGVGRGYAGAHGPP